MSTQQTTALSCPDSSPTDRSGRTSVPLQKGDRLTYDNLSQLLPVTFGAYLPTHSMLNSPGKVHKIVELPGSHRWPGSFVWGGRVESPFSSTEITPTYLISLVGPVPNTDGSLHAGLSKAACQFNLLSDMNTRLTAVLLIWFASQDKIWELSLDCL